jgi:phage internal scaffolding protein
MEIRKPFSRSRSAYKCNDLSRTKQSHKQECDINFIVNRYKRTGLLENARDAQGQYVDLPALEYKEAMDTIARAQSEFEQLPAKARAFYKNDPVNFLNHVHSPDAFDELKEIGLLNKNAIRPGSQSEPVGPAPVEGAESVKPTA